MNVYVGQGVRQVYHRTGQLDVMEVEMWFLLPLILWPLAEIGLFVTLGAEIGLWPTLAWVLISAMLGMWIIRRQGERAQMALRHGLATMSDPVSPMARGAMNVAAGALLILPGFLTDAIGLLLLLPPVRNLIIGQLSRRVVVMQAGMGQGGMGRGRGAGPDIIDGEFIELDAQSLPPRPDAAARSGWVQPD